MNNEERETGEFDEDRSPRADDGAVFQPPSTLRPGQQQELNQNQARPSGLDLPAEELDEPIPGDVGSLAQGQNDDEEDDHRSPDSDEPMDSPGSANHADRLGHEPIRPSQDDSGFAQSETLNAANRHTDTLHEPSDPNASSSPRAERPSMDIDGVRSPYRSDELTERKAQDWDFTVAKPSGDRATDPNRAREADPDKEHEVSADVGSATYGSPESNQPEPRASTPQK